MYCAIEVFRPCVSVAIEVAVLVAAMVAILRMRFSCLDPRVKCFTIDWTVRNIRRGFIFGHLHLGMIRYRGRGALMHLYCLRQGEKAFQA